MFLLLQGKEVLDNAFEGFNACLFAYGQTGSGKSYSIVGYGENKGIIPRVCDEIFIRIKRREDDPSNKIQHEVKLAMLQVYNEKVQDLLIKKSSKPKEDLAIREDPNKGVYVQDLSEIPVSSYEEINTQIELGTSNRAIGSTNMNATSSRAHTVTTITFT